MFNLPIQNTFHISIHPFKQPVSWEREKNAHYTWNITESTSLQLSNNCCNISFNYTCTHILLLYDYEQNACRLSGSEREK